MATKNKLFGTMKADGVDINNISNTPNETAQKIINGEYKKEYEIEKLVQQSNSVSSNSSNNKEDEIKSTIQDDDLVWLKFDNNEYWFTKQEIGLTFGILIIILLVIFFLYGKLIEKMLKKNYERNKDTQNTNIQLALKHTKFSKYSKILFTIYFIIYIFTFIANFQSIIETGNNLGLYLISIILSAFLFSATPLVLTYICKYKFNLSYISKLTLANTVIIYILIYMINQNIGYNFFDTIFTIPYAYLGYCILLNKKNNPKLNDDYQMPISYIILITLTTLLLLYVSFIVFITFTMF